MSPILLFTIITLSALGVLAAIILYFVAQKFKVYEDPRIDTVETMLPGANCGGCGFPGCRGFADALVKEDDIVALFCPVGGGSIMSGIASFLGKIAPMKEPMVAVVRCGGTCENSPKVNLFDGALSCAVSSSLYGGETGCSYGCLGMGDCVNVCNFDALKINNDSGLAEIIEEKCTGCGACIKACPKTVIELRKKGPKLRKVYVSCINKNKGAVARKSCKVACIACSKCVKSCAFEAITIENNLAYIDSNKCRLCRKCVTECPTSAIVELNFPPRKVIDPNALKKVVKVAPKATSDIVPKPALEDVVKVVSDDIAKTTTEVIETKVATKVASEVVVAEVIVEVAPEVILPKVVVKSEPEVVTKSTPEVIAEANVDINIVAEVLSGEAKE